MSESIIKIIKNKKMNGLNKNKSVGFIFYFDIKKKWEWLKNVW